MIRKNVLKTKLKQNRLTAGSWLTVGHTSVVEIMAESGFDWLCIDMEHSAISLSEAQNMIQIIELSGVTPLVRVGENSRCLIKRAMDAGSYGVIVPMINTREDAVYAIESVKYPPLGKRGVGLARAQGYGLEFARYRNWVNRESIVVAQIEHIKAIENLDKILKVEEIDASIIGPYDLSASLGHPGDFSNPKVKVALKRYEQVCRKLKRPMGIHLIPPSGYEFFKYTKKGYSFIALSLDTMFLGVKCREELAAIKDKMRK